MKNIISHRVSWMITTLFLFQTLMISAQITQTLKGKILDKESTAPIVGANIQVLGTDPLKVTQSDENGEFRFQDLLVGRVSIKISMFGYGEQTIPNIILNSGKEAILNIELIEKVLNKKEITVSAVNKQNANNEMAMVSARAFTVDEANRYAGSVGDPSRMASNFAGVSAPSDQRNDIIIRGNSPSGLLWRMDGIDIPNPNHFSGQGSTGGPVSILNNNTLRNSDFFTGAWPSEYGNSTSGVFDLKLRAGNNEKHEFTGQVGFNGFEGLAEGPIQKSKGSSYLVSYRYSVLEIVKAIGINVGYSGIPRYQDLTFKIVLPSQKGISTEIFGVGGISNISLLTAKKEANTASYGTSGRDVLFGSEMGVFGLSFAKQINNRGYLKLILSQTAEIHRIHVDSVSGTDESKTNVFNDHAKYYKSIAHLLWNQKIGSRIVLKSGIIGTNINFNLNQEAFQNPDPKAKEGYWVGFNKVKGNTGLMQVYSQMKYSFNDKFYITCGLHGQMFLLNNTYSIEPRASARYQIHPKFALNAGYGLHGQIAPVPNYYYNNENDPRVAGKLTNKELGFYQSNQFVLGFDYNFAQDFRLKVEGYYQSLYNVPVQDKDFNGGNAYSVLNSGADFALNLRSNLVNKGTGSNKGIEFTLEKFFSKKYYFLTTLSLFDSKYKGSDNIERNTAFNTNYTWNNLAGKEFVFGKQKNKTFLISGKSTYSGGRRYTPADSTASLSAKRLIVTESKAYSLQYPAYFRIDVKFGIKINAKKFTQEFAIDIQNVFDRKNILQQDFSVKDNKVIFENQLGRYPYFTYRVQF